MAGTLFKSSELDHIWPYNFFSVEFLFKSRVLLLVWTDDSNNTPQLIFEFGISLLNLSFGLLMLIVEYHWNCLDKPVLMTGPKPGLANNPILFCWLFTIRDLCKKVFLQTLNQGSHQRFFPKVTIQVCVSCFWLCPGTSEPSTTNFMVSLFLCSSGSGTQDGDEGVAGRNIREECFPNEGSLICHPCRTPSSWFRTLEGLFELTRILQGPSTHLVCCLQNYRETMTLSNVAC